MNKLYTVEEVAGLIGEGKRLLLAGDEGLLKQLPPGYWIGGTIPYFMTDRGGEISRDKVFVTEMPSFVSDISIQTYSEQDIDQVYSEAISPGFSVLLMPSASPVHLDFALKAPDFEDFLRVPLIGWITGVHVDDLGRVAPRVFYGPTKESYTDRALVMHCSLPPGRFADLDIINSFEPDRTGPAFQFPVNGFSAGNCLIDDEEANLAEFFRDRGVDTKFPLVADYNGTMINISIQTVDPDRGRVDFYAPVFAGVTYHLAKPIEDFIGKFQQKLNSIEMGENIFYSCNCVLNFLYGDLEGRMTGPLTGPATFGEVAYQLLNQTLVYLRII
jgi:hypothetical protein